MTDNTPTDTEQKEAIDDQVDDRTSPTRRTILQSTALAMATGVGATAVSAQDGDGDDDGENGNGVENGNGNGNGYAAHIIDQGPTVGLEVVADGLTAPVDFQIANEDTDRRFIVDQTGQIYVHGEDELEDEPFLDLEEEMVDLDGDFDERGLLGLEFHPDFEDNGRFYVRYSADGEEPEYGAPDAELPETVNHLERLSQFETADDDNSEADPDSEQIILEIPQPQFNHNAGPVQFGPDGYLYIPTGDGGGGNDNDEGHVEDWYDENEGGNGQDTEQNLLGGMLRIDVETEALEPSENDNEGENGNETNNGGDGNENENGDDTEEAETDNDRVYAIPDDNPLVDEDGHLPEYWAWGMRNPWGMSFENGELLAADVGQALFEIINHVEEGGNYSWNVWEGTHCFSPDSPTEPPEDCPAETPEDVRGGEPLRGPVIEYPQEEDMGRYGEDENDTDDGENGENDNDVDDEEDVDRGAENDDRDRIGTAIVGGRLYEGDELEDLEGAYVFGDWSWDGQGGGRLFLSHPPDGWPNGDEETDDVDEDDDANDEVDENDDAEGDDEETNNDNDEETNNDDNDTNDAPAPDEADLWPIEELSVESDDDIADDGVLNQLVYAFGRDADGELYVLTSDTGTIEGEGYVSRIVAVDDDEEMDD